jgi:quinol monooxygenase YgiN
MVTSMHVTITVDPSKAYAFLEAFKSVRAVLAETPENLATYMYRNPKVPGEFKLVENWNADPGFIKAVSSQAA